MTAWECKKRADKSLLVMRHKLNSQNTCIALIHPLQPNLFTELQRNPSVQNAFLKNNASKLSHLQRQKDSKTRTEITHWGERVGREMKEQELHSFVFRSLTANTSTLILLALSQACLLYQKNGKKPKQTPQ